MLVLELN